MGTLRGGNLDTEISATFRRRHGLPDTRIVRVIVLTQRALREHRDAFVTEEDFARIAELGLNAVRIPFGYWCVTGPTSGDLYRGPCLDVIDRAVEWAGKHKLEVVLDLHGNPGGETGERPCGRADGTWTPGRWRTDEAVEALKVVAARYADSPAVTGVQVCNEPAQSVSARDLFAFYVRAAAAVRDAGMAADRVTVILPAFTEHRLPELLPLWAEAAKRGGGGGGGGSVAGCALDLHYYQAFGWWWQRQSARAHLRLAVGRADELRRLADDSDVPTVVGEWSLALPGHEEEPCAETRDFAAAQLHAYERASHGWFFWNWRDGCGSPWSLRDAVGSGLMKIPQAEAPAPAYSPPKKGLFEWGA